MVLCIACLLLPLLPEPVIRWCVTFLWLAGPAANLVHGTGYLIPFFVGTAAIVGLCRGFARTARPARRRLLGAVLLVVWMLFGVIAYAPGA